MAKEIALGGNLDCNRSSGWDREIEAVFYGVG